LEAINAEKEAVNTDYCCVGEELEASLATIAQMDKDLKGTCANLHDISDQLCNKARQYDDVSYKLMYVTTKYDVGALLSIMTNEKEK
jgi:hypothetical protein